MCGVVTLTTWMGTSPTNNQEVAPGPTKDWVAVKELKLSYHNGYI